MTAAAPHIWTPPKWLVNPFAHLKKASSGHLLKTSTGHLSTDCSACLECVDTVDVTLNLESHICPCSDDFANDSRDWSLSSVDATYTISFGTSGFDFDGNFFCTYSDTFTNAISFIQRTYNGVSDCSGTPDSTSEAKDITVSATLTEHDTFITADVNTSTSNNTTNSALDTLGETDTEGCDSTITTVSNTQACGPNNIATSLNGDATIDWSSAP